MSHLGERGGRLENVERGWLRRNYAGPINLHTKAHLIFSKETFESERTYNYHLHLSLRDPNRHSALSFTVKINFLATAEQTGQNR